MVASAILGEVREGATPGHPQPHNPALTLPRPRPLQLNPGIASYLNPNLHPNPTPPHTQIDQSASALERVLLDGGPTRIFVPADVELLTADVASIKQLFHADGDGVEWQVRPWGVDFLVLGAWRGRRKVELLRACTCTRGPMRTSTATRSKPIQTTTATPKRNQPQDIDTALSGVTAILSLMEVPTQQLVQRHSTLRRQALISGTTSNPGSAGGAPLNRTSSPSGSPRFGGMGGLFGGGGAAAAAAAQGSVTQQPAGGLASRLGAMSSFSSTVAGDRGLSVISQHSAYPASDASGMRTPPGARTPPRGEHRRTSSAGSGVGASPLPGSYAVAPVGRGLSGAEAVNNDQVRRGCQRRA